MTRPTPPSSAGRRGARLSRLATLPLAISSLAVLPGCEMILGPDGPRVSDVEVLNASALEGVVGEVLTSEGIVRVIDEDGNPIEGIEVFFRVAEGSGSVSEAHAVSDAQGGVRLPIWTLGPQAGPQHLEAGVEEVATVQITAQARAGEPAGVQPLAVVPDEAFVASPVGVPEVQVLDRFENPVPGATVRFAVTSGAGEVEREEALTDDAGVASAGEWVLGVRAGENRLEARVEGVEPRSFVVTGRPMEPAQASGVILGEAGNGGGGEGEAGEEDDPWAVPEVLVGHKVPVAPTVRVQDAFGNGVPAVGVRFRVVEGSGYLSLPDQVTDSHGRASPAHWQVGIRSGLNAVVAEVDGLDPVRFEAVALPGGPNGADYASLHHQHAPAGSSVPIRPAVRVWDVHGNPVPDVAVQFEVTHGNGSLSGADATTNHEGVARLGGWTLQAQPGENRVRARVSGFDPFVFIAVGEVGGPAEVRAHQGSGQSAAPGVALPIPPAARVLDAVGNPVANVEVHFQVTGGGGSILGARPRTNGQGVATAGAWTLGSGLGEQTLRASVSGASPATFTATATVGPPSQLTVHAGSGQSGPTGAALPVRPAVRVTDAQGHPVSGVSVSFGVTRGGGSIAGANSVTDANGVARAGNWTLGPDGGLNRVTATASGLGSAVFDASAVPDAWPIRITANVNSGGQVLKRYINVSGAGLAGQVDITEPLAVPPGVVLTGDPGEAPSGWSFSHWEVYVYNASSSSFNGLNNPGPRSGNNVHVAQANASVPAQITVNGPVEVVLVYSQLPGGGDPGNGGDSGGDSSPGPASEVVLFAGNNQTVAAGSAVPVTPTVVVRDADGNGVPGVTVNFSVTGGGGHITKPSDVTNSNGGAQVGWTLGTAGGTNTLQANVPGVGSVTFSATATGGTGGGGDGGGGGTTPGPASQITIHSGNNQTAAAGTAVSTTPTVLVRDANGNGVSGVTVNFAVTGGGGSLTKSSDLTNANGGAQVGWTLGTAGGTNTMQASVSGVGSVTFMADATGGGSGGGGGGSEPPPPPPPGGSLPPAPGACSNGWSGGNTIPLRLIEGGSQANTGPVKITVNASGHGSRTMCPGTGGMTVSVPRGVHLQVIAHFEQSSSAGVGGWGFSALKMKAMNNLWGFAPHQVHHGNAVGPFPATPGVMGWERFTTNTSGHQPPLPGWAWGGALQTYCGSVSGDSYPFHTFWSRDIASNITTMVGVDFLVVWILDHQYPRASC